jgi:hypothetical protein
MVICDHAGAETFTLPALSTITEFPHMVVIGAYGAGDTTVDPGTDEINGSTNDIVLTGGESDPGPATIALVAWDTTDDWTIASRQGTVT